MTHPGGEPMFYAHDNVHLTSVGVDIGSTTSHLVFSRIHLRREASRSSSRYVVVSRRALWASPIRHTPYRAEGVIDAEELGAFVAAGYRSAALHREDVDTGVVLLTGEALRQRNARAIADALSEAAGDFVCVAAGHHLEALLAAHGSGVVATSTQRDGTILCIDIGGGTTKLSLVRNGVVEHTAALDVGARLVAWDDDRRVTRVTGAARSLGVAIPSVGEEVSRTQRQGLAEAVAAPILEVLGGCPEDVDPRLLLTGALEAAFGHRDAIAFTGGVAEYVYRRTGDDHGDLGPDIAEVLVHWLRSQHERIAVIDSQEGIRATVVGLSQWSVQLSGSTVSLGDGVVLPLRNVLVVHVGLDLSGEFRADDLARSTASALRQHETGTGPVAVALPFAGAPSYQRLRALAEGLERGLEAAGVVGGPVVVLTPSDVAASLGALMADEFGPSVPLLCLDHIATQPFDFVDVGRPVPPAGVFPVVIKSLLFATPPDRRSNRAGTPTQEAMSCPTSS